METVPIKDSVKQWQELFSQMVKGFKKNLDDVVLEDSSYQPLTAEVRDIDGNVQGFKHAANISPPAETPPSIPEVYAFAQPVGTSAGTGILGKMPKKRSYQKKPSVKKKASGKKKSHSSHKTTKSTASTNKRNRASIIKSSKKRK